MSLALRQLIGYYINISSSNETVSTTIRTVEEDSTPNKYEKYLIFVSSQPFSEMNGNASPVIHQQPLLENKEYNKVNLNFGPTNDYLVSYATMVNMNQQGLYYATNMAKPQQEIIKNPYKNINNSAAIALNSNIEEYTQMNTNNHISNLVGPCSNTLVTSNVQQGEFNNDRSISMTNNDQFGNYNKNHDLSKSEKNSNICLTNSLQIASHLDNKFMPGYTDMSDNKISQYNNYCMNLYSDKSNNQAWISKILNDLSQYRKNKPLVPKYTINNCNFEQLAKDQDEMSIALLNAIRIISKNGFFQSKIMLNKNVKPNDLKAEIEKATNAAFNIFFQLPPYICQIKTNVPYMLYINNNKTEDNNNCVSNAMTNDDTFQINASNIINDQSHYDTTSTHHNQNYGCNVNSTRVDAQLINNNTMINDNQQFRSEKKTELNQLQKIHLNSISSHNELNMQNNYHPSSDYIGQNQYYEYSNQQGMYIPIKQMKQNGINMKNYNKIDYAFPNQYAVNQKYPSNLYIYDTMYPQMRNYNYGEYMDYDQQMNDFPMMVSYPYYPCYPMQNPSYAMMHSYNMQYMRYNDLKRKISNLDHGSDRKKGPIVGDRALTPPAQGWYAKYSSGVTGVVWDRVHQAWVVSWTLAGKRTFRHFTCKSYGGFDKAREAAIEFRLARNKEIAAYNKKLKNK